MITLAVAPGVPLAGTALILGIDRFMSDCRTMTNFVGSAVATLAVAKMTCDKQAVTED